MMKIERRFPKLEITKEKYWKYLKLSYDDFWNKTLQEGFTGEGCYYRYMYCIKEQNDSDESRLSYLNYLINEKGFDL